MTAVEPSVLVGAGDVSLAFAGATAPNVNAPAVASADRPHAIRAIEAFLRIEIFEVDTWSTPLPKKSELSK